MAGGAEVYLLFNCSMLRRPRGLVCSLLTIAEKKSPGRSRALSARLFNAARVKE
jgi:hypothetical protein